MDVPLDQATLDKRLVPVRVEPVHGRVLGEDPVVEQREAVALARIHPVVEEHVPFRQRLRGRHDVGAVPAALDVADAGRVRLGLTPQRERREQRGDGRKDADAFTGNRLREHGEPPSFPYVSQTCLYVLAGIALAGSGGSAQVECMQQPAPFPPIML